MRKARYGLRLLFLLVVLGVYVRNGYAQSPMQVEIARDSFGVPHIFGKTDKDVAYGLAWAHAEDDFKTIQEMILIARGRYGEYAGKNGAVMDFLIGYTDVRNIVERGYDTEVPPGFKGLCEAYCAGLNEFARLHPKEVIINRLFPVNSKDMLAGYMFTNCLLTGFPFIVKFILEGKIDDYKPGWYTGGSNGIAISGKRTTNANTFLAINSHQPLEGLFSWYEAHVKSEEGWEMIGGLFPGGNLIFHGISPNLGWACTLNWPDVSDVYRLEMHPKDKLSYRFEGKWLRLQKRIIKLRVKVGGIIIPVKKTVYTSVYGPTLKTKFGVFATANTALLDLRAGEQLYKLNKAQNLADFKAAFQMNALPSVNFIYADKDANIHYLHNAKLPRRDTAFQWAKVLPGNTARTLWNRGFVPIDSLPQYTNPACGYLYNANNTPFNATAPNENLPPKHYPESFGIQHADNNRSIRLKELFDSLPNKISYQDFERIKYDNAYPKTGVFQEIITRALQLPPEKYPDVAEALRILQRWNRVAQADNRSAGLATVFCYELIKKLKLGTYQLENGFEIPEKDLIGCLRITQKYLLKNFGSIYVELGAVQRHIRGKVDLPIGGMPDVLAATYVDWAKNPQRQKRLKIIAGESYIMMVQWGENGIEINTVNAYGTSNRPESKHYTDQMQLFTQQKTKPMTFDKAQILKNAVRIYHPTINSTKVSSKE